MDLTHTHTHTYIYIYKRRIVTMLVLNSSGDLVIPLAWPLSLNFAYDFRSCTRNAFFLIHNTLVIPTADHNQQHIPDIYLFTKI